MPIVVGKAFVLPNLNQFIPLTVSWHSTPSLILGAMAIFAEEFDLEPIEPLPTHC